MVATQKKHPLNGAPKTTNVATTSPRLRAVSGAPSASSAGLWGGGSRGEVRLWSTDLEEQSQKPKRTMLDRFLPDVSEGNQK